MWGISMEDFGVLWVWEFCGNSHGFFLCGNGMGMGIEIQFPRQPCASQVVGWERGTELSAGFTDGRDSRSVDNTGQNRVNANARVGMLSTEL